MSNDSKTEKNKFKKSTIKKYNYTYINCLRFFIVKHDNVSCQIIRYTKLFKGVKVIVGAQLYTASVHNPKKKENLLKNE